MAMGADPPVDFWKERCRAARFPCVTGEAAAKPSSAAFPEPFLSESFDACRFRSLGVGVALRDLTRPATGSNCRPREIPREMTLPLLLLVPLAMLETSLSESEFFALLLASWLALLSVTAPTARSTFSFHALIRSMSRVFMGCGSRKKSVYRRSLRSSISSNTLLHFLITSLNPLKVVSSLRAPRVAVSTATSSTNASKKSIFPIKSHRMVLPANSSSLMPTEILVSPVASSVISCVISGLVGVCPTAAKASFRPTASSWKSLRLVGAFRGSLDVDPGAF
mmetsp:Transcript_3800/g.9065  ORF Transcript_3800/g.9065 Transcript_3800/m.9065 type:complete len:280 (-) Transcript_3800:787-1626(-)